jgi:hypothetical protein
MEAVNETKEPEVSPRYMLSLAIRNQLFGNGTGNKQLICSIYPIKKTHLVLIVLWL